MNLVMLAYVKLGGSLSFTALSRLSSWLSSYANWFIRL